MTGDVGGDGWFKSSNSAFFPIDGELLGNEDNSHTYHFTYELAGTLSFSAADTFPLGGDDDLGGGVDGNLAMDLGGVHRN